MPRIALRRCFRLVVAGLVMAVSGCSLRFGGAEEPLPLIGESIAADRFPRLNRDPVDAYLVLTDGEGGVWAVLFEHDPAWTAADLAMGRERARLVRLDHAAPEEIIEGNFISVGRHMLYVFHFSPELAPPTNVRLVRPGHGGSGVDISIPASGSALSIARDDKAFVFHTTELSGESRQLLVRGDGSFQRELPPRSRPEPESPLRGNALMAFDASGDWLLRQQPDGQIVLYSTRDNQIKDLGIQDWFSAADDEDPVLYTCDRKGLKRVPFDKSAPTLLDSAACWIVYADGFGSVTASDEERPPRRSLLYTGPSGYYAVPKLGGPIERLSMPDDAWLMALSPQRRVAYAFDVSDRYGNARGDLIVDGWVDDWQFMKRGRDVDWSVEGTRLRWLENAARSDNTGDLMSVRVEAGVDSTQLLSRNVYYYSKLADGRVLAVSNAASYNAHSRIILIDEDAGAARRVVEGVHDYLYVKKTHEILVEVWSGDNRVDVHRVPLPAK